MGDTASLQLLKAIPRPFFDDCFACNEIPLLSLAIWPSPTTRRTNGVTTSVITVNDTRLFASPRMATATSVGSAIAVAPSANSRSVVHTVSAWSPRRKQATPKLVLGGVHAIATASAIRAAVIPAAAGCRHGHRARHERPGDRDKPLPSARAPEPGLEFGTDGKDHRDDQVEPGRASGTAERRRRVGTTSKLDVAEPAVISRWASRRAERSGRFG